MSKANKRTVERSVAVFAHNEAENIGACLSALQESGLGSNDRIHVLINGATDDTEAVVRRWAKEDGRICPVIIALGDKANAWSYYVNRLPAPDAHLHVFVDGDVRVSPGAISAIEASLAKHPEALAAATLPRSGRTSLRWSRRILREHGMPGNFYALRGQTLAKIRSLNVFMPVGLIGDDPFLRWLLLNDFSPSGPAKRSNIRPVPDAHFDYDSIAVKGFGGLRALVVRQLRYQVRDLQMNLLKKHLSCFGLSALPRRIDTLYDSATPLLALRGQFALRKIAFLYTYFRIRNHRSRSKTGPTWYEA